MIPFERHASKPKSKEVAGLKEDFLRYVRSNPKGLKIYNQEQTLQEMEAVSVAEDLALWLLSLIPLPHAERLRIAPLAVAEQVASLAWLTAPERQGEVKTNRPLTDQDRAFLKTILEVPDDVAPYLVYADWLEERNDPRAELIRVQCQLDQLDAEENPGIDQNYRRPKEGDNRRKVLGKKMQYLLDEYGKEWQRPLLALGCHGCHFGAAWCRVSRSASRNSWRRVRLLSKLLLCDNSC